MLRFADCSRLLRHATPLSPQEKVFRKIFFGGGCVRKCKTSDGQRSSEGLRFPSKIGSLVKSRIILRKTKQESTFFDSFSVAALYWCPENPSETDTEKAEKRGECPPQKGIRQRFRPFFKQAGAENQSPYSEKSKRTVWFAST